MSAPGHPKCESLSAEREGSAMNPRELRALALLLDYPTATLTDHLREIEDALAPALALRLRPLFAQLESDDLITLQQAYLDTFDRGRRTALNLFEHVHGDSRDRGQAMVDLLSMYEQAGIHYVGDQLPDYLPVFLDYLALLPVEQACEQLADVAHILQRIEAALARRASPYQPLLGALLARAAEGGDQGAAAATAGDAAADDDTSYAAIDAAYAEAPVNFIDAQLQTACRPPSQPTTPPTTHRITLHRRAA